MQHAIHLFPISDVSITLCLTAICWHSPCVGTDLHALLTATDGVLSLHWLWGGNSKKKNSWKTFMPFPIWNCVWAGVSPDNRTSLPTSLICRSTLSAMTMHNIHLAMNITIPRVRTLSIRTWSGRKQRLIMPVWTSDFWTAGSVEASTDTTGTRTTCWTVSKFL